MSKEELQRLLALLEMYEDETFDEDDGSSEASDLSTVIQMVYRTMVDSE